MPERNGLIKGRRVERRGNDDAISAAEKAIEIRDHKYRVDLKFTPRTMTKYLR